MTYFTPRIAPSGSLTAGVPAATYPAGSYAFRTSILVLALEPIVDNAAFVQSLADFVARGMSGRLRSGRISVGGPSRQAVPRDNSDRFGELVLRSLGVAAYGGLIGGLAGANAAALANALGWLIGEAGNVIVPDFVDAQWVTIDGIIDSPTGPVTTAFVTQAIASALDTTLRLRTPRAPYAIIQPNDAQVGASVIARTREDGACSGHRRLDKVIAAACTRLEAVAPQPIPQAPPPTAPPQTYPQQQPTPPQTQRPTPPRQQAPVGVYTAPSPPSGTPAWVYYAGGATLVAAIAAWVVLDD